MPVFTDSRYQTATPLLFVDEFVDPRTGEMVEKNPLLVLDDDRKQWSPSDFADDELELVIAYQGEKPDQIAYRKYRRADLAWIVGEFNDNVGFDMFTVFDGGERLVMPSLDAVLLRILPNQAQL